MRNQTGRRSPLGPRCKGSELSVVMPTFNEHHNIEPLLTRLETALSGIDSEVI